MNYTLYTLCRSGNHVIIGWILRNLCNNPIKTIRGRAGIIALESKPDKVFFRNNVNHTAWDQARYKIPPKTRMTITSYEDTAAVKKSTEKKIVIIREFGNLLASRFQKYYANQRKKSLGLQNQTYLHTVQEVVNAWKTHARLALRGDVIAILYDKWVVDKAYRDKVMHRLGHSNTKDDMSHVTDFGGGSSFIGMRVERDTSHYLRRYERVKLPPVMKQAVLRDKELLELNTKLFGVQADLKKELR